MPFSKLDPAQPRIRTLGRNELSREAYTSFELFERLSRSSLIPAPPGAMNIRAESEMPSKMATTSAADLESAEARDKGDCG